MTKNEIANKANEANEANETNETNETNEIKKTKKIKVFGLLFAINGTFKFVTPIKKGEFKKVDTKIGNGSFVLAETDIEISDEMEIDFENFRPSVHTWKVPNYDIELKVNF